MALTMFLALAGCHRPASADLTVQQLMGQRIKPAAQTYWTAVRYVSDAGGARTIAPSDEAGWKATQGAATALANYARALQSPAYGEGRDGKWSKLGQGFAAAALQAQQAAGARNGDAVFAAGSALYDTCAACHSAYGVSVDLGAPAG